MSTSTNQNDPRVLGRSQPQGALVAPSELGQKLHVHRSSLRIHSEHRTVAAVVQHAWQHEIRTVHPSLTKLRKLPTPSTFKWMASPPSLNSCHKSNANCMRAMPGLRSRGCSLLPERAKDGCGRCGLWCSQNLVWS